MALLGHTFPDYLTSRGAHVTDKIFGFLWGAGKHLEKSARERAF